MGGTRKLTAAALTVAALLVVGGCSKPKGGIGEFASLTGTTATFGKATDNGVRLALEQGNAGKAPGAQVPLAVEDDQSKPDTALAVVKKLVTQDRVLAVLGEVASSRTMAAAPVCQQYKVPLVSPSSTNPKVTQMGDYIFRVCFTDDFQAGVVAHFAHDQGYQKVAIFKDIKNAYSVGFADYFSREFTKLGGKVVGEQTYQEGDTDFKAQLNSLKGLSPDAVLVPGYYSEVGTIGRQAREIGLTVPLLGGDGWDSPQLIPGAGGAGGALEGCFFSDHYFSVDLPDPNVQQFVKAYRAKYNEDPDALAALGYDAGRIILDAMRRAKAQDGPAIRDALAQTKDFPGITGTITIDANRNARKPAVILQVKGAKFVVYRVYRPEQIGL